MSHGCEVQLLAWSNTSSGGARIVLQIADEQDLAYFQSLTMAKGKIAGQRLMAAFEEIADDETPAQSSFPSRNAVGPLCQLAVMWCKSEDFYTFLRVRHAETWTLNGGGDEPDPKNDEDIAKGVVLDVCEIESRKDLDSNDLAAALFNDHFRTPFKQWLDAGFNEGHHG